MPEPIVLILRDQKFELENGVPFRALKYLNSNDMERVETGITKLLGEDADVFWELEPSVQEVLDFLKQVADALGFDELEGNPTKSPGSSTSTGRRSKPTSNVSTE
jgi:hypothetical protein